MKSTFFVLLSFLSGSAGAMINQNTVAETKLLMASLLGNLDEIDMALASGARLTCQQPNCGDTCVHYAAKGKNPKKVLSYLIDLRADINWRNFKGNTALHCAVLHKRDDVVEFLSRQSGIDLNICNNAGGTPLAIARQQKFDRIVQLLLQVGAYDDCPQVAPKVSVEDVQPDFVLAPQEKLVSAAAMGVVDLAVARRAAFLKRFDASRTTPDVSVAPIITPPAPMLRSAMFNQVYDYPREDIFSGSAYTLKEEPAAEAVSEASLSAKDLSNAGRFSSAKRVFTEIELQPVTEHVWYVGAPDTSRQRCTFLQRPALHVPVQIDPVPDVILRPQAQKETAHMHIKAPRITAFARCQRLMCSARTWVQQHPIASATMGIASCAAVACGVACIFMPLFQKSMI